MKREQTPHQKGKGETQEKTMDGWGSKGRGQEQAGEWHGYRGANIFNFSPTFGEDQDDNEKKASGGRRKKENRAQVGNELYELEYRLLNHTKPVGS